MAKKANVTRSPKQEKSVNIKKVQNGYTVNSYNNKTGSDKTFVARNSGEAKRIAGKLL